MQSVDSYAAEEGIEIAVEHWNRDDMEHDRVAGASIPEHINKCGFWAGIYIQYSYSDKSTDSCLDW